MREARRAWNSKGTHLFRICVHCDAAALKSMCRYEGIRTPWEFGLEIFNFELGNGPDAQSYRFSADDFEPRFSRSGARPSTVAFHATRCDSVRRELVAEDGECLKRRAPR